MRGARLAYVQALRANPAKLEAWLEVREFLEKQGAPDLVDVNAFLVRLRPSNLGYLSDYVESAVRFARMDAAQQALEAFPYDARDSYEYALSAGMVDARSQQHDSAVQHFQRALEIRPDADKARLHLAMTRIAESHPARRAEGKELLASLAAKDGTEYQRVALREIVKIELASRRFGEARKAARKLASLPDATFSDRILQLESDYLSQSPTTMATLRALQLRCLAEPSNTPAMSEWFLKHREVGALRAWISGFSEADAARPEILLLKADLAVAEGDWDAAQRSLLAVGIPGLRTRAIELAFETLRESKRGEVSRFEISQRWRSALDAAEREPATLQILQKLAKAWNWDEANEAVLWEIVRASPRHVAGWSQLVNLYAARTDVPRLRDALEGMSRADPGNLNIRNDWIMLDLLLNRDTPATHELASALYQQRPTNPFFVSTYAFALVRQNRIDESIRLFEALPADELSTPARALYYGTALAMAGRNDDALRALDRANQGKSKFLPQEKFLWEMSLAIARGERKPERFEISKLPPSATKGEITNILKEAGVTEPGAAVASEAAAIAKELGAVSPASPEEIRTILEEIDASRENDPAEIRRLLDEIGAGKGSK